MVNQSSFAKNASKFGAKILRVKIYIFRKFLKHEIHPVLYLGTRLGKINKSVNSDYYKLARGKVSNLIEDFSWRSAIRFHN
jgi:hypothetical protein